MLEVTVKFEPSKEPPGVKRDISSLSSSDPYSALDIRRLTVQHQSSFGGGKLLEVDRCTVGLLLVIYVVDFACRSTRASVMQ